MAQIKTAPPQFANRSTANQPLKLSNLKEGGPCPRSAGINRQVVVNERVIR